MQPRERGRTPAGFRTQLLQRLRNQALATGVPAHSLQQRIAYERLLARLPRGGEWVLKGGFALQFRYGLQARPTRDVDLRTTLDPATALDHLRRSIAAATDTDNFTFELGQVGQEMQGAPGGSLRIRVVARVAGLELVTFHLDVSSGDALVDSPELLSGSDLLQFAAIAPVEFPVYPIAQHLAEKLHAYTLPRSQENTRVRDLVDLAIIAVTEQIEADRLFRCVEATFAIRGTHPIPKRLPEPPSSWIQPFASVAAETAKLPETNLQSGYSLAALFWNPFLSASVIHQTWLPDQRTWSASP
ncbi:MAG: nucleotidyl transferase AbiEii/AbiGii toxin family protein [Chloroflexi bacterium]|nr:nucleotidyl transferase AbiEii/AbiGii toxin family protein [Chloroflexota bacterium]